MHQSISFIRECSPSDHTAELLSTEASAFLAVDKSCEEASVSICCTGYATQAVEVTASEEKALALCYLMSQLITIATTGQAAGCRNEPRHARAL